ncbi:hypothetical protein IE53DRAFT_156137 [Violaceomyces palustris]|uniref:Uncharacterized protein n=1 Tax=Violaceomyces palustris TaxID=1673888 RepID=A0ACD0NTW4_9BASI|nr:hypothetical protein IE53DRAFT_156137 [Violaceomyces palustris]
MLPRSFEGGKKTTWDPQREGDMRGGEGSSFSMFDDDLPSWPPLSLYMFCILGPFPRSIPQQRLLNENHPTEWRSYSVTRVSRGFGGSRGGGGIMIHFGGVGVAHEKPSVDLALVGCESKLDGRVWESVGGYAWYWKGDGNGVERKERGRGRERESQACSWLSGTHIHDSWTMVNAGFPSCMQPPPPSFHSAHLSLLQKPIGRGCTHTHGPLRKRWKRRDKGEKERSLTVPRSNIIPPPQKNKNDGWSESLSHLIHFPIDSPSLQQRQRGDRYVEANPPLEPWPQSSQAGWPTKREK